MYFIDESAVSYFAFITADLRIWKYTQKNWSLASSRSFIYVGHLCSTGMQYATVFQSGLGIRSFDFRVNRLFFVQKWANERFTQQNERFTHSLIFGEQPERFAHDCSFLLNNLSELLMVAHFWWATWAICSHHSPKKREWANHSFFK